MFCFYTCNIIEFVVVLKRNGNEMQPQVEVAQLDGSEFLVKVFCEHKYGGFVRLMEALNSLGLEVTNVNTTRHTCLVSNIFKVEVGFLKITFLHPSKLF